MRIGPIVLDPPVVLAPMAGVTNVVFRSLCREYGAGLYVSEMISARALVEANARTGRMLAFAPDEEIRSVQLAAVDPAVTARAVRRLVDDHGVDHVDLNFGCPAAKVTRKGGGAALPLRPVLFGAIVEAAVAAAAGVPVTVKMRVGLDAAHPTALAAGRIAQSAGVAAVALHARTAEQHYSGRADWQAIGELKAALTDVPVLGNGDVWDALDARRMMHTTGCDGVVVGRGCLGRPWLFRDLVEVFAGREPPPPPTVDGVRAVMRRHAALLCAHAGERAGVRDFRKHIGWYLTGYPVGHEPRRRLTAATTLAGLHDAFDALDPGVVLPAAAARLPRGHTNGPRRVRLPEGWLARADDPTPPSGADVVVSGG